MRMTGTEAAELYEALCPLVNWLTLVVAEQAPQ